MHMFVIGFQWIVALTILFELALLFSRIKNQIYAYIYILCVSMLVSAYGYLLNLTTYTLDGQFATHLVVWAGRVFTVVSSWRFTLRLCKRELPRLLKNLDMIIATLAMALVTTTRITGLFYSSIRLGENAPWPYLVYDRGYAYYIWDLICLAMVILCIYFYTSALVKEKDPNKRKQFIMLSIGLSIEIFVGLLSMLPAGRYYDFNQPGFLASSVIMVIAIIRYNLGDIEATTKEYMFDKLTSGVIAVESNGEIAYYNKTAENIFPEIKEHPEQALNRIRNTLKVGNPVFYKDQVFSPEEKDIGDERKLVVFYDSTTHYKHITELEEQRKIAEEANRAKTDFLASMSHEIRTPINTVLGMDEMILRESTDPSVTDYALDIQRAGSALLSIVNDILDLNKIESGKMEIVPVTYDVAGLLYDASNMIRFRTDEKGLSFKVCISPDIPSKLVGDDIRIRQVLVNLLTNAVKYTKSGSVWFRVSLVNIEYAPDGSGEYATLYFEVEDTGIGIKPEDRERLFSTFDRIEPERNRNIEGTGLGVPITTRLLNLMDTTLNVQSEYGKGSIFSFVLRQRIKDSTPIGDFEKNIEKHTPHSHSYTESFIAPSAHILLVDDNSMNRKVFVSLLKKTEIKITEAENGPEAINLASSQFFDIIFMDHMMPDMDGVVAMRRIRAIKDGPCANTPIIVLTANAIAGAKEAYIKEGFDGFLSKPVTPDKLESLIKHTLPESKLEPAGIVSKITINKVPVADTSELPVIFGLDWKVALMRLQDKEILDSILSEFNNSLDYQANKLQIFKDELPKTFKDYRILVHGMKSSSGSLGIITLSGMAAILEKAATNEDRETIDRLHDVFIKEWRSYKEHFKKYLTSIEPPAEDKDDINEALLSTLLNILEDAMEDLDIDRADKVMDELSEFNLPDAVSNVFDDLKAAVSQLDQGAVKRILKEIR